VIDKNDSGAKVQLSMAELRMINNALNEVCNGVHIPEIEFETRLGQPRETYRQLLEEVHAAASGN